MIRSETTTKGLHRSLATGSLIWACSAAPALAAAWDVVALDPSYHLRNALLLGSLVLLVAALALRIGRRRREAARMPTGPDLRWWKSESASEG